MATTFDSPWVRPMGNWCERYLPQAQHRVYRAGSIVYTQGDLPRGLYYLAQGRIRMSIFHEDGTEKILAVHAAPAHFGESAACDGLPHFTTVTTLEESHVHLFSRDYLLHIARENPEVMLGLMQGMACKMRLLTAQVETLALLRAEQRVAHMLTIMASSYGVPEAHGRIVALPLTHQDLAAVTGTSRVTVTLILKEWKSQGIISKTRRGCIQVLDEERLRQRARGQAHGSAGCSISKFRRD